MGEYTLKRIRGDLNQIKEIGAGNVLMIRVDGDGISQYHIVSEMRSVEGLFDAVDNDDCQFYALLEEDGILPDVTGSPLKWSSLGKNY